MSYKSAVAGAGVAQAEMLTGLSNFLGGQIGQPGPVYSGDLAPPPSQLQDISFANATQFATGPNAADPALARLLSGETGFVPDTGQGEAYYQANVAKPLAIENTQNMNAIDQRLALRGLGDSGVRARAFTDLSRNYIDTLNKGRTEFAYKDRAAYLQSRESALDRMSGAIAQSLGLDIAKVAIPGAAGDVQREIQGQQAQDPYRRFLEAQPIYNPALQLTGGPVQQAAAKPASAPGTDWGQLIVSGLTGAAGGFFG